MNVYTLPPPNRLKRILFPAKPRFYLITMAALLLFFTGIMSVYLAIPLIALIVLTRNRTVFLTKNFGMSVGTVIIPLTTLLLFSLTGMCFNIEPEHSYQWIDRAYYITKAYYPNLLEELQTKLTGLTSAFFVSLIIAWLLVSTDELNVYIPVRTAVILMLIVFAIFMHNKYVIHPINLALMLFLGLLVVDSYTALTLAKKHPDIKYVVGGAGLEDAIIMVYSILGSAVAILVRNYGDFEPRYPFTLVNELISIATTYIHT